MKICLCGSTRFKDAFNDWNVILTKAGHVVYTICTTTSGPDAVTAEEKRRYDLIHLKKISESDAILVLNVDGYFGDSTEREIEWARMERKDVYWLENNIGRKGEPLVMGASVWSLYNLFDGGLAIASVPETLKYKGI